MGKALHIPKILRSYPLRGKLNGQPIENISGLIGGFHLRKPMKLFMPSVNYADGKFYIGNIGLFSNFHDMLLGNMKRG